MVICHVYVSVFVCHYINAVKMDVPLQISSVILLICHTKNQTNFNNGQRSSE